MLFTNGTFVALTPTTATAVNNSAAKILCFIFIVSMVFDAKVV
jgi:hypothetical protein